MKLKNRCCYLVAVLLMQISLWHSALAETSFLPELEVLEAASVNDNLSYGISSVYKIPLKTAQAIVHAAERYADPVFPKKLDILSVIAVESRFQPTVVSLGNYGLMQVNLRSHKYSKAQLMTIDGNIKAGAAVLKECFSLTKGDIKGSILSYNSGFFGYKKGIYNPVYFTLFERNLRILKGI